MIKVAFDLNPLRLQKFPIYFYLEALKLCSLKHFSTVKLEKMRKVAFDLNPLRLRKFPIYFYFKALKLCSLKFLSPIKFERNEKMKEEVCS